MVPYQLRSGCLYVLIFTIICKHTKSSTHYHSLIEGNELEIAFRRLNHTRKFDYNDYFADFECKGDYFDYDCMNGANRWHRGGNLLWTPKDKEGHRKEIDCQYSIEYVALAFHSHPSLHEHTLVISQGNCKTDLPLLKGGTSFDIFAYDDNFLLGCTYSDQNDDTYIISCKSPFRHSHGRESAPSSAANNITKCLQLTIILYHEHFDAYGLAIADFGSLDYFPGRHLIADNQTFCGSYEYTNHDTTQSEQSLTLTSSALGTVPGILGSDSSWALGFHTGPNAFNTVISAIPSISWHSGAWAHRSHGLHHISFSSSSTAEALAAEDASATVNEIVLPTGPVGVASLTSKSAYEFKRSMNQSTLPTPLTAALTSVVLSDSQAADFAAAHKIPKLAALSAEPGRLPDDFLFHAMTVKGQSSSFHLSTEGRAMAEKLLALSDHNTYHFIGASHMRYDFDLIVESLLGREKLKSVGRKHSSLSFHNFNSHDSNFLAWQATVIENLCNGFTAASPDSPTGHTLILQTGAWDLSVAPIPRILLGTKGGEAVFSVLRRLLSGTLSCPNMNHFVFVTAVPYPVCYNDQVVDCEKYRGYRSNAAIAAMNQYMVNALVDAVLGAASNTNSSAIPAIHVSVVDAYSIIKPRLIFSDDSEVMCTSHYLCRVKGGAQTFDRRHLRHHVDAITAVTDSGTGGNGGVVENAVERRGAEEEDNIVSVYTPGGDAVLLALLTALTAV